MRISAQRSGWINWPRLRQWCRILCLHGIAAFLFDGVVQAGNVCASQADFSCVQAFALPDGGGMMHYYASRMPADAGQPDAALVILHGHGRDANKSFVAGLQAAQRAGELAHTLVVAPLFQVADDRKCHTPGVPSAGRGDAVWTCSGWQEGAVSLGASPVTAFAALDALLGEIVRQWPALRTVTVVGFSAGAQLLQRSIGFAAPAPAGVHVRYVVADPGSWLYFDPVRPVLTKEGQPADWSACMTEDARLQCTLTFAVPEDSRACPGYNDWKYGTQHLPANAGKDAAAARAQYARAHVHYLAGQLDSGHGKGAYARILDQSCPAMLQGPFRLQRALAYADYVRRFMQPAVPHTFSVISGCAHDVACVIGAPEARPALFGRHSGQDSPSF